MLKDSTEKVIMKKCNEKSWRNDAYSKVTGRAKYADDFFFTDMLHAVPVYSDYIHAEIISIDTKEALDCKGVIRVLTAEDIPGKKLFGQINKDMPLLAYKKIRYHGEPVAIVVAESREIAIEASKKVRVNAKVLPALLNFHESLNPDAVLLHENTNNNLINAHHVRKGDAQSALQSADLYLHEVFHTAKIEHAYLETEGAVVIPRFDGIYEVYGSMQHPFSTRRFTANYLGLPLNRVEVKTIPMGGGFGGKDDTAALVCARAALAAYYTQKPVKMIYDREWSMKESYKRHSYKVDYQMGVSQEGQIQSVSCHILADGGAYTSVTPWVTWRSTVQCCGPYKVDHVFCDTHGVYSNTVYTGAFRGFGSPQMNFVIEQMVERAAERLGMDEIEFRKKNMLRQGDTTITGQILDTHAVSLEEVLDKILAESDYYHKKKNCSYGDPTKEEWYGIGLAMSYRGMSLGAEGKDFCSAIINVQFDGSILLEAGVHENGQGSESAMIEILAQELGVSRDRIQYRMSSSSNIPDGGTTVASRGTLMGGGAVVNAAKQLKSIFTENLKELLNSEELIFKNDQISGQSGKSISFVDAVTQLFLKQSYPYAFGVFQAPKVSWDEATGQGNAYFTWVYGCQVIELSVNPKKQQIKLLNAYAAHDVGRVINPGMLLGQFFGGMTMGMGYALMEEVKEEEGMIKNLNYHTYPIMKISDIPEMNAYFIENNDPLSPSGAKGIGEPTLELMAPAIANALYRATGIRLNRLPLKKELFKLLKEKQL